MNWGKYVLRIFVLMLNTVARCMFQVTKYLLLNIFISLNYKLYQVFCKILKSVYLKEPYAKFVPFFGHFLSWLQ